MIANTTIIVGNKTFQKGETVIGLSEIDKKWMLKEKYIVPSQKSKEEPEAKDSKKRGASKPDGI